MYFCGGKSHFEDNKKVHLNCKSNIPTIFKKKLNGVGSYRYQARFRFRSNTVVYYKCLGETFKYFRIKANITQSEISKYLGFNDVKIVNIENGSLSNEIGLMFIDEFCSIVKIEMTVFIKKFKEIWNNCNN